MFVTKSYKKIVKVIENTSQNKSDEDFMFLNENSLFSLPSSSLFKKIILALPRKIDLA
jgi:CHAT domain-containing protein